MVTLSWKEATDKDFKFTNDIENWFYCPVEFNPADMTKHLGN